MTTTKRLHLLKLGAVLFALAQTPDGKLDMVSNTDSGDVSIVDVTRRQTVKVGESPKRLTVGYVVAK